MNDGVLLVDKPGGLTSHDVVARCRRLFGRKDIGHAGTLDPMATGLLVVLIGKATKISDYILNGNKSYRTTVLLGTETDTDDITGAVTASRTDFECSQSQVEHAVAALSGVLNLPVPIYSAIKVKGKKLYEQARRGESFVPPMRDMEFKDLKLLSYENNRVTVEFECSKGSYVRAWGKALGQSLGCGATLESLRRVHSEPYYADQAIELAELESLEEAEIVAHSGWVPLKSTLPAWPMVKIEGHDEKLISNGQLSRRLERFLELEYGQMQDLQGIKVVSKGSGQLISLLSFEAPLSFKIRRVFPNQ